MKTVRNKRVTDLFREGTELVLSEDGPDGPVLIWLKKLNPFEDQEIRLDGQAARSDKLLELRDPDSREMRVARATATEDWDIEQLLNALLNAKLSEMWTLAQADVDASEEWHEHVEYIRRGRQLLADDPASQDEDVERYNKVHDAYVAAQVEALKERQENYRQELLTDHNDDERYELYYDMVRERAGMDVFGRQRRFSEIWYACRDCEATKRDDGTWDHEKCRHEQLWERAEIPRLGQELLVRITQALDEQTMSYQDAGNSAAPTSSSVSLEQSSAAEAESNASSPEEMSDDAPTT